MLSATARYRLSSYCSLSAPSLQTRQAHMVDITDRAGIAARRHKLSSYLESTLAESLLLLPVKCLPWTMLC